MSSRLPPGQEYPVPSTAVICGKVPDSHVWPCGPSSSTAVPEDVSTFPLSVAVRPSAPLVIVQVVAWTTLAS